MICKNCNAEIDNSSAFCINCGTPVENGPAAQPVYQQPAYQPQPEQPVYQQQSYQYQQYRQPAQTYYSEPAPVAQAETAPVTKIKSYIGWFFINYIPVIGFILAIVFAVDSNNKNRANFFRAQFAIMGIVIAISILLAIIVLLISLIFGVEIMDELYYMM